MSRSRRPSVSIYDYPEDLNPFKDSNPTNQTSSDVVELRQNKEPKNKFWTFGRSKKKRSNSFSVKSAWSGLFGKRKDIEPEPERRTTITTVSTSYQNGQFTRPIPPPRSSRDQQEFENAFGTFTRRKKYTMESSSTYGSNLTVNGDPARLYNGSPQETTASILGDLTPKPPARRFGQVSPRPKNEIPPLEFEVKEENSTTPGDGDDRIQEEAPVPTRRHVRRSIPRVNVSEVFEEDHHERGGMQSDFTLRDENENLSDDFVFRRCSQDAVRRSNVSINSCVSTASGMSTLGRKKRRAPQPPQRKETSESPEASLNEKSGAPSSSTNLEITEPIDIAKVTEDIQEMTKQSQNIDETMSSSPRLREEADVKVSETESETRKPKVDNFGDKTEAKSKEEEASETGNEESEKNSPIKKEGEISRTERIEVEDIELNRILEDKIEIITEISEDSKSEDSEDVETRKKTSGGISRSDSFSVKEQIEQIERQIKELEAKNLNNNVNGSNNNPGVDEIKYYEPSETRLSIQENRRSFFKNMVSNDSNGVKIEIKELPREQKEIHVVKLTDSPVPINAPKEPVKIVQLHISEPIKHLPEIVDDFNVNPLPKPRRHSSTPAQSTLKNDSIEGVSDSNKNREIRGDSL